LAGPISGALIAGGGDSLRAGSTHRHTPLLPLRRGVRAEVDLRTEVDLRGYSENLTCGCVLDMAVKARAGNQDGDQESRDAIRFWP